MRHLAALALLLAAGCSDVPNGTDGTCGPAPRGTFWDTTDWSRCVLICPRPATATQVVCGGGYTGDYGSSTGAGNGSGTPECVDIGLDPRNCGACGNVCSCRTGQPSCEPTRVILSDRPRPAYCTCR